MGIDDRDCCRTELFGIRTDGIGRVEKVLVVDPPPDPATHEADLIRSRFDAVTMEALNWRRTSTPPSMGRLISTDVSMRSGSTASSMGRVCILPPTLAYALA